jgi:hypothetical protein
MRTNCCYQPCYYRAGKNGFCLKHKEIAEVIEALLLLKNDGNNKGKVSRTVQNK